MQEMGGGGSESKRERERELEVKTAKDGESSHFLSVSLEDTKRLSKRGKVPFMFLSLDGAQTEGKGRGGGVRRRELMARGAQRQSLSNTDEEKSAAPQTGCDHRASPRSSQQPRASHKQETHHFNTRKRFRVSPSTQEQRAAVPTPANVGRSLHTKRKGNHINSRKRLRVSLST